jgi:hypothetical protein
MKERRKEKRRMKKMREVTQEKEPLNSSPWAIWVC